MTLTKLQKVIAADCINSGEKENSKAVDIDELNFTNLQSNELVVDHDYVKFSNELLANSSTNSNKIYQFKY